MDYLFRFLTCVLAFFPMSALKAQGQPSPGATRAVVVGVSHYQDPLIPDLKYAHHDAEAFATFLMSPGGGGLLRSDIVLLTNDQATAARFATALDWLFEQKREGHTIIYFSGYGGVVPQSEEFPGFFLMNDSPISPLSAGAFDFPAFLQYNTKGSRQQLTVIANTYPIVLPPDMATSHFFRNYKPSVKTLRPAAVRNTVNNSTFEASFDELSRSKISLNNILLDGLLGLADRNEDLEVTMRELAQFIKNRQVVPETWPGQLSLSFSDKNRVVAKVDKALLDKLSEHSDDLFPAIIHLETTPREDALLREVGEPVRHLYQDFVVALKLGHLLEPADRYAADLYDNLAQVQALSPLHGDLRRKLIAALMDETQQALNAYLRTDIREILNRSKDERYNLYPQYLSLALRLLGEKHYLKDITLAKQLYFEGLLLRFQSENNHDPSLLSLALEKQTEALNQMPEAAFIINEIGVIYVRMGQDLEALARFRYASELAPNWSIPYSNICSVLARSGNYEEAIEQGKQAIRLSPRNVIAFNNLGTALFLSSNDMDAEKCFVRAISYDSAYHEPYYNLACLKARQGQPELALEWLEKALHYGFDNLKQLDSDADLEPLRALPTFKALKEKYMAGK